MFECLLLLELFEFKELVSFMLLFVLFETKFSVKLFWEFEEILPLGKLFWEFNVVAFWFILLFEIRHWERSAFNTYPYSHCEHIFGIGHFIQFIIVVHFSIWFKINLNEINNMNNLLKFMIRKDIYFKYINLK